ncbi:MAG: hypothetical protein Q8J69_11160 [Sphingobacteriaceae bacterium]|nr:hypothetical protein [Sphingobacteriaceae bacterium]
MKKNQKFDFVVERTKTGFSAYAADLPVFSTGKTISILQKNLAEALALTLDVETEAIKPEQILLSFDLKQFFQHYRVLNVKFLAERIGMNPSLFSQYVQGHKKPSAKQTARILQGIHEVGKELVELELN